MAFTWTDEMGDVSLDAKLEKPTRDAIIAAAEFLDAIPKDAARDQLPRWNQSTFAVPANKLAQDMEKAIVAKLPPGLPRLEEARIVSVAVRLGIAVRDRGGGQDGWAALHASLPKARVVRGKLERAAARGPQ